MRAKDGYLPMRPRGTNRRLVTSGMIKISNSVKFSVPYTKFDIESHVTELQLLNDMRAMQRTADARLEDMSRKIDVMLAIMTSGNGLSRLDASQTGYIEEVEDDVETDLSGTEDSVATGESAVQVKEENPPE
ncbi:hypothetical protein DFH09DRAFT_1096737 [Mycena vulgaris]|nr:hypothetical protein DFH09DRAFT_1096737 [Mycena vulgaris]